jgi:deferrochelatase/peroxidase EfeB
MQTHKFQIGQTVFLIPFPIQKIQGGAYIVTRKLPEHNGEFEYRVKSAKEPHERVVGESELSNAP